MMDNYSKRTNFLLMYFLRLYLDLEWIIQDWSRITFCLIFLSFSSSAYVFYLLIFWWIGKFKVWAVGINGKILRFYESIRISISTPTATTSFSGSHPCFISVVITVQSQTSVSGRFKVTSKTWFVVSPLLLPAVTIPKFETKWISRFCAA